MIRVIEQVEPADFSVKVRQPGERFLRRKAGLQIKSRDWENHWKHCLGDLRAAYHGICAYTASFVPADVATSIGSVDHFLPKKEYRSLAYEWSNYRFCTPRVNSHKDNSTRVMDPFFIRNGWFVLDFDTYLIRPADGLPPILADAVQNSIDDLKLNDDDVLVQARADQVQEYIEGHFSFDFLERRYPFIAGELGRQGLSDSIKSRKKRPS